MNTWTWIVLTLFTFLSFIPVVKLDEIRTNYQYRILWVLSIIVLAWILLNNLNLSTHDPFIIYYTRLISYPVVYGVAYAMFATFQIYTKHKTPRWFHIIAISFFFIELILAITNTYHFLIIKIPYSEGLTREAYNIASRGWFFYVHTAICYVLLLLGFIRMLSYLNRKDTNDKDVFPFRLILVSLVLGIMMNMIHLFVFHFPIDPTYGFVVIVTFILYTIIYKRDFNVNLILSSRKVLFNNLREMYVIVDHHQKIIEYSRNLIKRFNRIRFSIGDTTDEFFSKLKKYAICYKDIKEIKGIDYNEHMVYLHVDELKYRIDRFSAHGDLILLYDETTSVRMMYQMDVIRAHDQMSHLYNRNFFEETKDKFEKDYPNLGLIMIDLDGLKLFNDYLGHREGDQLIIRFAQTLLKLTKLYDDLIPIRFGGDEFILLAKEADQKKLDQLIQVIVNDVLDKDPLLNISLSYGKAVRRHEEPIRSMINRADERLYQMKEGRKEYKDELVQALKEITKTTVRKGLYEDQ